MKRLSFAACAIVLLAACVQGAPPSTAVRICDDQGCSDRPKNQATFDPNANQADAAADARIAALKKAAYAQPHAAYDLGLRYFRGDGVRQDSYQALTWMRDAAERGDLRAQKALGSFYLFGLEEMGPDPREAEKWLLIASDRGDDESKKLLAQATAAKQSDEAWFRWQNQWRTVYLGYWGSGYPYYGFWRQNAWNWY